MQCIPLPHSQSGSPILWTRPRIMAVIQVDRETCNHRDKLIAANMKELSALIRSRSFHTSTVLHHEKQD